MCCVQTMPVDLFQMFRLSVLLMRNNPLKEIPPDIRKLQYLHTAALSFCQLTTLPPEYEFVAQLAELSI